MCHLDYSKRQTHHQVYRFDFYDFSSHRKDLLIFQKVTSLIELHKTFQCIRANNGFAPNPEHRDLFPANELAQGIPANAGIFGCFLNGHTDAHLRKHFRLSDGSFVAVNYGLAVHYEDSEGNWQDIDNSIAEDAAAQTYNLERDDAIISFASSLTNGKVLTTSKDGASITMTLLDSAAAQRLISGQEVPVETAPEETVPAATEETESQMTEPVATEPIETQPEETVPEVTDAPVTEPKEAAPEDVVAEFLPEIPVPEEEATTEDVAIVSESDVQDNASEKTEPVVTEDSDEEEPTAPDEAIPETTVPDETAPETTAPEVTDPVETTPEETEVEETEPEETELEETEPEETVPQETAATDILNGLTYDRNAVARIKADEPSLLELQETTRWNVEDVIPANLQSSLVYENVFPDTDLLYTAYGYNLKEQIVMAN